MSVIGVQRYLSGSLKPSASVQLNLALSEPLCLRRTERLLSRRQQPAAHMTSCLR